MIASPNRYSQSPALVAPPGLIVRDGALIPRRMGLADPTAPFVCGRGHKFNPRGAVLDGVGGFHCREYSTGGAGSCDCAVLVIEGAATSSFRADVTIEEFDEFRRLRWRAAQINEYLGSGLPNAA